MSSKDQEKTPQEGNALINESIERYTSSLNSQKESFSIRMNALSMHLLTVSKKIGNLEKEGKFTKGEDSNGKKFIKVPMKYHVQFDALVEEMNSSIYALSQMPKEFVVSLVCIYDAYVGDLIKSIYITKPDLLKASNIDFKSGELLSFSNIEEIKEYIIEKEIDNVLRDNHMNQIKWLENKLSVKLMQGEPHFSDFEEIMERRNLFVHSDGKVSRQYLKICGHTKYQLSDILSADATYIRHCYEILFEIGVKLGQVVWRKMNIGLEKCDESLQNISYELIKKKQYKLAETILHFATEKSTKHYDKNNELIFIVNKALAFHLQNKQKECLDVIDSYDWSAYDVVYKLAKETLENNYDFASILMKQMKNDEKDKMKYQEWPLFRKFRETQIFQETYKEIFNEDFEYKDPQKTNWKEIVKESNSFIEESHLEKVEDNEKEDGNTHPHK